MKIWGTTRHKGSHIPHTCRSRVGLLIRFFSRNGRPAVLLSITPADTFRRVQPDGRPPDRRSRRELRRLGYGALWPARPRLRRRDLRSLPLRARSRSWTGKEIVGSISPLHPSPVYLLHAWNSSFILQVWTFSLFRADSYSRPFLIWSFE